MQKRNGPRSGSQLPLADAEKPERADARRNRLKVLAAAERLFAEQGVRNVSLDAIAAAAGVGKGTVFRRFGDRAGLAVALLDERERELQERILDGPPPLGPGAPAAERLCAFLDAYVDLLDSHVDLLLDSENAATGSRYRVGAYRFWHRHVAILLEETHQDTEYLAHALLAPLAADLYEALRSESYDVARVKSGLRVLVTALTTEVS
jgi:AcrR family transcriptional regulator